MYPRLWVIILVLGASPLLPTLAHAGPSEDLRDAENSYLYGDYPRVIRKVTPLVEPDILIPAEKDLTRAYELLGLAHFFLDEKKRSRIYFEKLIRMRPGANLDPVLVPPPAVAFFQAIKTEHCRMIRSRFRTFTQRSDGPRGFPSKKNFKHHQVVHF